MATRYVTVKKAEQETGYSKRAIETKIDRGVWVEGREYIRAPDRRILIDLEGYEKWVQHQAASKYDGVS
ncbi:MAG: hypothetical protein PF501_11835 [Salinisphaera sp.]|jgi:hypothetical protein|nr:hypothetical protein [Salinisphaera sp.]